MHDYLVASVARIASKKSRQGEDLKAEHQLQVLRNLNNSVVTRPVDMRISGGITFKRILAFDGR